MKLNLIVIQASNMERSVAFYESLGMSFIEEQHGNGPKHLSSNLEGMTFEIYPGDTMLNERSIRLGFSVSESLDELVAQLEQNGTKVISPPKDSPWGRRAVVADPNGYRVELTAE